jgi:ABC-type branched-subunit amino acid transport system ATPase component/branched-subunit amino acid ABC-type transport system permease component
MNVDLPAAGFLLGLLTGMTLGLSAVGLVLVYRSSKLLNLAHGEIGAFGAAVLLVVVTRWDLPYWMGVPFALGAAVAMGTVTSVALGRLRKAPVALTLIATLGAGQVIFFLAQSIAGNRTGETFPQPPGFPSFRVGALLVTPADSAMLVAAPLALAGVWFFLTRTGFGLALRGAADNPTAARSVGIHPGRSTALAWAIAGGLSALTALLLLPSLGADSPQTGGSRLILRALAAAAIAGMSSLPIAFVAGTALGVGEILLKLNVDSSGVAEGLLFVVIVLALLVRKAPLGREREPGSWVSVASSRPPPEPYLSVPWIRRRTFVLGVAALGVALVLAAVLTNSDLMALASIFGLALVALSAGMVASLTGHLSLGHFAIAAVGATVSAIIVIHTGNYFLGFGAAGMAGATALVALAVPALRSGGPVLAVTTFAFAVMAPLWLLQQRWMLGDGRDPGRPIIAGTALDTGRRYYLFSLAFLVAGVWLFANVRRSGVGRSMIAVRDNVDAARAFSVRARLRVVEGLALGGFLAGLGGAVYGHGFSFLTGQMFVVNGSVEVVAMAAIGGLGTVVGAVAGALYVAGIPTFVDLSAAGLAATAFGWFVLLLYVPSGLAGIARPGRERVLAWLATRAGVSTDRLTPAPPVRVATSPDGSRPRHVVGEPVLEAVDLRKRFGGVEAVAGVDVVVRAHEVVGVVGPNGAGKTVLLDLLSGFAMPDSGSVAFAGRTLGSMPPEIRARHGLVRSFQEPRLYPTMTVLEAVQVSLERTHPSRLAPALLGLRVFERAREARARALVDLVGLGGYRRHLVTELSTGTRRLVEVACLVGLEPRLLLLDEPSLGLNEAEVEPLGDLLLAVKERLGAAMVLVEHNVALVTRLADRVVVLQGGRVAGQPSATELWAPSPVEAARP